MGVVEYYVLWFVEGDVLMKLEFLVLEGRRWG